MTATNDARQQMSPDATAIVPHTLHAQPAQHARTSDTTKPTHNPKAQVTFADQQMQRDNTQPTLETVIDGTGAGPARKRRMKGPRTKIACVRCKSRHVPCIPSEMDPEGPCMECLRIDSTGVTKPSGDNLPCSPYMGCFRFHSKALRFFRVTTQTALTVTRLSILNDTVFLQTKGRTGYVSITYQDGSSFLAGVGPLQGQEDHESGAAGAALAIDDVQSTKASYRSYLKTTAMGAIARAVSISPRGGCSSVAIIADVLALAVRHTQNLGPPGDCDIFCVQTKAQLAKSTPKDLLQTVLTLWLGMRQSTVAASPVVEYSSPASDSPTDIGTPKIKPDFSTVLAQMDSIRGRWVLQPLSRRVIAALEDNMRHNRHENWLEVFLTFFIIQAEIGNVTGDACLASALAGSATGWAHGYPGQLLYHEDVISLHEAATRLLSLWHYFNRGTQAHKLKARHQSTMYILNDDDFRAICDIYRRVDAWKANSHGVGDTQANNGTIDGLWADPMYFAAQMFEGDTWVPWEGLARQRGQ